MKQQACAPLSSDFSASFSFMRRAALDFFPFFCYNFFMTELFYAPRGGTSRDFVSRVLGDCYGFGNATFSRSASGKPLCDAPVCFSLSHTREYFFLAVSEKEVGADAESLSRLGDFSAIISRLPESERRESEIVGFLGGLGAVSGNAIADEPSTDGVGVGVDSDIATEPAPAQRGDTATWHCVSIDGEPRNWITRPVLADMDELSIIVEEG